MLLKDSQLLPFLKAYAYPACVFYQGGASVQDERVHLSSPPQNHSESPSHSVKPVWNNDAYYNNLDELQLHWEAALQRLLLNCANANRSGGRPAVDNASVASKRWVLAATMIENLIVITATPRQTSTSEPFAPAVDSHPPILHKTLAQVKSDIDPQTVSAWSKSRTGTMVLQYPWESTHLGPIASWSPAFKSFVTVALSWPERLCLFLGSDLIALYNDAYLDVLGPRKINSLGMPLREIFPESWDQIGDDCYRALRAEVVYHRDNLLLMDRERPSADESAWGLEETYHNLAYVPLNIDGVVGLVSESTETTLRVLAERQMATFRNLSSATSHVKTQDDFFTTTLDTLARNPLDFPFAIMYKAEAITAKRALLPTSFRISQYKSIGVPNGHEYLTTDIEGEVFIRAPSSPGGTDTGVKTPEEFIWPFAECLLSGKPVLVSALGSAAESLEKRSWNQLCRSAVVFPVGMENQYNLVVVLGLNPCRPYNNDYQVYILLLQAQLCATLTTVLSFELTAKKADELARLDKAKMVFFGNASHELRTPLTLILAPLEDMAAAGDNATVTEIRSQARLALRNARRLHQLVNSFLDFARLEAGRLLGTFKAIDLSAVTTDFASLFRSSVEDGGVEYIVSCNQGPEVFVDLDAWEKVVTNIISNAHKYCKKGRIEVKMEYTELHAVFTCEDTGCGISDADLGNIFKRFHRVPRQGEKNVEGSGIGLALTFETVKLLGGTLDVQSQVGVGSTFKVSLPVGQSQPSSTAADIYGHRLLSDAHDWMSSSTASDSTSQFSGMPKLPALGSSEGASDTQDLSWFLGDDEQRDVGLKDSVILVADDNADLRQYCTNLLATWYHVYSVPNGKAAMEFIATQRVDLVLSDVQMPIMDGYELLRRLRQKQVTALLPVILVSAAAGVEARAAGLNAGADDYLVKPFSSRELQARVKSQLIRGRLRSELEVRIQDRTRLLVESERRLQQQISESEHMRKQQEIVVDLTSHELRNPLNAIWQNAELVEHSLARLRSKCGDDAKSVLDEADEAVRSIVLSVAHQTRIADDILNFSKISMSLLTIHRAPFPLFDNVQDVLRWWEFETRERGIKLEVTASEELKQKWVITDCQRVSQVLINFLTNAIRFTSDAPARTVTVFLETSDTLPWPELGVHRVGTAEENLECDTWLTIGVRDSGAGLSPEDQTKLFERFSQAHPSKDQFSGGHGLGLFVSRHITALLGGVIEVESALGTGSTFSLIIPIDYTEPQDGHDRAAGWQSRRSERMANAVSEQDAKRLSEPPGRSRHILVVEDNVINQKVLCRQLQRHGFQTSVAGDGEEALQLLASNGDQFDLVLMDIEMPVKDGRTACREYRDSEAHDIPERKPFIAVTGNAREQQVQECLDAGFDHVATKPYQITELVAAIEDLLKL